jgi:hypothetical protein
VGQLHWFIVIKYTNFDYVGKRVDAHYVSESQEALLRTSQGPMRPGERLRGFWVMDESERLQAIELHDARMLADRDWMVLVDRIESQWERVGCRVNK